MYEHRYLASDISLNLPPPAVDIPVDGPAAEVYRISPDEPWRVIRTKWRVAGLVGGPVEGGGRPSGYFTGATGVTLYKGTALGTAFEDNAFIGDAGSNLVHRKKLLGDGVPFEAARPEDEQKREFLASKDNWFRPVHFANAPDGALYIVDMCREVIEHPWSLPPNIKKYLDLNSGNDRGRIYRVVGENFKQPKLPKLSKASAGELVQLLEHPNGWHRETAARLLYERQDKSAIPALAELAARSKSELGRMHGLYALRGLSALTPAMVITALSDSSELVRKHAIRLSEDFMDSGPNPGILAAFAELAKDPSREVRYQLAWSLTKAPVDRSAPILAQLLANNPEGWEQLADLAAASRAPFAIYEKLSADAPVAIRIDLAELIGSRNLSDEVKRFIQAQEHESPETAIRVIGGLQTGLSKSGASLESPAYREAAKAFVPKAMALLRDDHAPGELQLAALNIAAQDQGFLSFAKEWLKNHNGAAGPVWLRMIEQLSSSGSAGRREAINYWKDIPAPNQPEILQLLLNRPADWKIILEAANKGVIPRNVFTTSQVDALRRAGSPETRELAARIFGKGTQASRKDIVDKFLDAAAMKGNPEKGRDILEQRCLICHQLNGKGQQLGPALESVRAAGKQTMLVNILDPNREIAPRFAAYEATTADGESYIGILDSESPLSINLLLPGGIKKEIRRDQLKSFSPTGRSLMPEALEEGLSKQDLADLLSAIAE
jgi:putative heme-binding domain-containing protein